MTAASHPAERLQETYPGDQEESQALAGGPALLKRTQPQEQQPQEQQARGLQRIQPQDLTTEWLQRNQPQPKLQKNLEMQQSTEWNLKPWKWWKFLKCLLLNL